LDENLILRAGAGTGKTHALVTLALQLLAGLRQRGAVEADRLWLATFTEKAAGELRARLRGRLRALADGLPAEGEPDLAAAAAGVGKPFPSADRWARLLEEATACRVTTLHGVGATLLRSLPGAGPAGGLEVWDAVRAKEALRQAVRDAALAPGAPVTELLLDLPLGGRGKYGSGLLDLVGDLHGKLAEDGVGLDDLGAPPAPPALEPALVEWRRAFEAVLAAANPKVELTAVRGGLAVAALGGERLSERWEALEAARAALGRTRGESQAAREAHAALHLALVEGRAALHWEAVVRLLVESEARYARRKQSEGAVDFADLCRRSRDLLRDDLEARRAAKEQLGALLLDETQDTNGLQLELCLLLCERRGAERRFEGNDSIAALIDLEPGCLCAVGDRKQSIYEFRGADVAVFERLASRVRQTGGGERSLRRSRRSRPALVGLANGLFGRAMSGGTRDFEVCFVPEDALTAERPAAGEPTGLLLELPEGLDRPREAEARALARWVSALLRAPPPSLRAGVVGEIRPGHVALLFRRLTNVAVFRDAFAAVGLPTAVGGGGGFYGVQEILDASALLSVCADGEDALATLTLLRSPWIGLLDGSIAELSLRACEPIPGPSTAAETGPDARRDERWIPAEVSSGWRNETDGPGSAAGRREGIGSQALSRGKARGLSFRELLEGSAPAIGGEEAETLERAIAVLGPLSASGELLGASRVLDLALARIPYAEALEDPQALANLAKLRGLLRRWEGEGLGLAAAADRLARLCRGEGEAAREPPADAADGGAHEAVRLLTIHEAKGLEFPVVVVPECGSVGKRDHAPILHTRGVGLGVKARGPDGEWGAPEAYRQAQELRDARERAQSLRLLYVAATRARELVVFSGERPRNHAKGTWRELLDAEPGLERIDGAALLSGPAPPPLTEAKMGDDELRQALGATGSGPPAIGRMSVAATAAADLSLCPRRWQLKQLWRLPEPGRESLGPLEVSLPRDEDPRAQGSRAHELLELVDLKAAAIDPSAAVALAAARLGFGGVEDPELPGDIVALLSSPLGRRICALPPERILRERSFVLRLGPLIVRGSIDLCCVLDDGLLVVDYKRGAARERADYRAQVEIYALAASRLIAGALPIDGALWFLGEADQGPRRWRISPERLAELEGELRRAAGLALVPPADLSPLPGLPPTACQTLECAYLQRCHPLPATSLGGVAQPGSRG
ncbi:MAG: UvrD-helicase domain-containing protein, partial [Deltaproteobacteria bacterium]